MFDANGKAMLFYNSDHVLIQGNIVTYCKDTGSAGIRFEGGDSNVTIVGNTLYGNPGNVIRIDTKGVSYPNFGFSITGNNIYLDGTTTHSVMFIDAGQYQGTLDASNNWWGNTTGPGSMLTANNNDVVSTPFATTPFSLLADQSYLMLPSSTDGIIQVENYDQGGEGVAYHDVDSANLGLANVRQPWGVDVQTTTDVGGGYNVGYTKAGEWLDYTVNIAAAGTYDLDVRVAYSIAGGQFHFELDGVNITGTMTMPNTGGTQTWKTMTLKGLSLPAGVHVLRLVMDKNSSSGSVGNFNWFELRNENPIPVPAAPGNLAATLTGPTSVNLSWTDNSSNETGFIIERSTDGVNFSLVTTTAPNVTGYIDSTVSPATTYTYRVRATNGTGDSANSNLSTVATPVPQQTVYLSDLSWTSATNGYGPVEKDMSVGQSGAGDGMTITLNGVMYAKGLGVNSVSDITYKLGGKYNWFQADVGVDDYQTVNGSVQFQVFADGVKIYDSGVMGPTSLTQSISVSVAGVKTLVLHVGDGGDGQAYDWADWAVARLLKDAPPMPPVAPAGLVATAASGTEIDLLWSDVTGETGYRIERSSDGVHFTPIGTVAANVTMYADKTVSGPGTYLYRVIATNGVGDSPASNLASAAPLQPPTAPDTLAAALNGTEIDLSWADHSDNETGFIIERSTDGVNYSPLATTVANVTAYADTSPLALNTTYSYRVRATNGNR